MTTSDFCEQQYGLVCDSRKVLFEYCKTISQDHFLKEHSSFGRGGSIRNLLVHIANTYEFWIAQQFLKKEIVFTEYSSIANMDGVVELFNSIDNLMQEFFSAVEQTKSLNTDIGSDTKEK